MRSLARTLALELAEHGIKLQPLEIELLGKQTDVVCVSERRFECGACPLDLVGAGERAREPEGTDEEGAVLRVRPAADETTLGELALDRVDRATKPIVIRGRELHQ